MRKTILLLSVFAFSLTAPLHAADMPEAPIAESVVEGGIQISFSGKSLRVVGAQGQTVEIYNVTGVRVFSAGISSDDQSFSPNLSRGCYIVKVGKVVRKINIL